MKQYEVHTPQSEIYPSISNQTALLVHSLPQVSYANSLLIQRDPDYREISTQLWDGFHEQITALIISQPYDTYHAGPALLESLRGVLSADSEILKLMSYAFSKSGNTKEEQIDYIFNSLTDQRAPVDQLLFQSHFSRVAQGVTELMQDILYWGAHLNAAAVTEIIFTESDLHDRGLGASIVTYKTGLLSSVKKVIKPDNRSIDRSLLGSQPGSLANQFNRLPLTVDGDTRPLGGQVRTRTIDVSGSHGSMEEFIPHLQIKNIPASKRSSISVPDEKKTQIFSALTGLEDLHYENLVYTTRLLRYYPAVIDSDMPLSKRIWGSLKHAASWNHGFHFDGDGAVHSVEGIDASFIKTAVKAAFQGVHGRVVPIMTSQLQDRMITFSSLPSEDIWDEGNLSALITNAANKTGASYNAVDNAYAEKAVVLATVAAAKVYSTIIYPAKSDLKIKNSDLAPKALNFDMSSLFSGTSATMTHNAFLSMFNNFDDSEKLWFCDRYISYMEGLKIGYESVLKDVSNKSTKFFYTFLTLLESGTFAETPQLETAPGLQGIVGPAGQTMTASERKTACEEAVKCFKAGQIPFYEYHYSTGEVKTNGQTIWNGPTLDELFSDENAQDLADRLSGAIPDR
ncbi:hypothetical protein [Clostridium sp. AM58-1XD]|uniref:hypothetical protein n=1 Tax=Clostridium sp. AM58-1XD TaxID=2292307 RepID=UPI000E46B9D8|nr:hypothetical protein [Clostridium sp. AM58-1XD]RGY96559.1 hypothetical protein DXA13_16890 [Clostridium sp. AM58-1XD]